MMTEDDAALWQRRFRPCLDAAWRLARWLTGNRADADDVLQEACLRAWRADARAAPDNPRAWLLTIVRNTALSRQRSRSRRPEGNVVAFDLTRLETERSAPDGLVVAGERTALLRRALADLPPSLREVVVLRDLEDLCYAEIAAVIGAPVGTVMSRLSRGRSRLRSVLDGMAGTRDAL